MRMSCAGMQGAGDAAGDGIQLDADEMHAGRGLAMKLPVPHPGSSTVASGGTPSRRRAPCMARMTIGEV